MEAAVKVIFWVVIGLAAFGILVTAATGGDLNAPPPEDDWDW